jgi:hypothetical protein
MIRCGAIVENYEQRENLLQCLEILGVQPCVYKYSICMFVSENDERADKLIELFEQYPRHEIHYE